VIAFGKGGALETIIDGKTGLFFAEQSMESLQEAVERFDQSQETFLPQVCRANAERFSESVFHERFKQLVAETLMSAEFS
jgi:glycosyltransferase involved in cell wall biosynthesis